MQGKKSWLEGQIFMTISLLLLAFLIGACGNESGSSKYDKKKLPDLVDFNFHIKPILSDRCFACHGPDANAREGDLRLDTEEGAFAAIGENKDRFPIVPGDLKSSQVHYRITSDDPEEKMPPPESNLSLTDYEIKLIDKWIEQGAEWKKHWSFIPLKEPDLPVVEQEDWVRNPIDNFVLSRLEKEGLKPTGEATKETLIRRASLDITGLPPTLEEVDAFVEDTSPNAYEKLVDRLLDSPAYGERMAMEWMDVARYADSHGYQDDVERVMWPWRDWVIKAFNKNLPFDDFIEWQIAGDLLENPTTEQILATAFNRNHMITQEGGIIEEEYRVEYVADRTNTTGKAFLGLTLECARCHEHKYDPISQKDYYQLFAFYNNVPERGLAPYQGVPDPKITLTKEEVSDIVSFVDEQPIELMVMSEMDEPRDCFVLVRGGYENHGEKVEASAPKAILEFADDLPKNRIGLVKWLTDEKNPLTTRVLVNRYWQLYFGTGIVSTPEDFGNQGALPSHPELLDWLAWEFIKSGWDLKALHKLIVTSATYRQSSQVDDELYEYDPQNILLARGPRHRLSAEMLRDYALSVSGLLVDRLGGPSVKPYQPEGLWAEKIGGGGGSLVRYKQSEGEGLYRKSLYTFWKRTVPPPSMMTFDASERNVCTVKRQSTSTPLQALVLLNDPQYTEASRVLAERVVKEGGNSIEDKIQYAFRTTTARYANEDELAILKEVFDREYQGFNEDKESAEQLLLIGEHIFDNKLDPAETAAYTVVVNTIFNLSETITKG
ncbi:PSD1 and planctomycete cytochrome C domain-containing protein [Fulvivirgaceae bacterium BMA10]|uniref:PSD1 and planctomycete cytochrome C domain-containing protein n=1 Tax=Splendidivirga corallicola TaxID=3051826 RepID=A0ABT8KVJ5_9BACT|nr:PSD1 and planctomycete cytochrome C domain-containing protein [Fulvivirgaceae bacterium BMA10]